MKRFEFLLSKKQDKQLKKRAQALGFFNRSDYIRFILFIDSSFQDKIDEIHAKVVKSGNPTR
ncbi:hypothetical protein CL622_03815 [archaeon]|nr:hypothetical protein [archaeon]|tara:strand:+ start:604 stop:789 length:186 start_codon:yes stop_codon:yes gene_type:complete